MKSHDNRRNYSRSRVSVGATLTPEGEEPFGVEVADLSMTGVFLRCTAGLPVGCKCTISILFGHFMHELPIVATARVVRVVDGGMALRFDSVRLESSVELQQLVVEHADDPEQARLECSKGGGWIFRP
ncbi:PilZ domain-containing protein [Mariprofundus erugo]|uniref:PilZ domain-containing protein n=1 Tax=Mariprofundus erugo TaxID=2528639 RepID=A0A5R9GRS5_9PROT|nr:PilZ domain-containing protein [Mariprofundus erugo]TLS68610.1 PilZ domain-containing protein [Mariprofundus erugo]TLS77681.1 PilZ domain-containing protein [Mariprofundus erugo]